jgi:hypothetical protein
LDGTDVDGGLRRVRFVAGQIPAFSLGVAPLVQAEQFGGQLGARAVRLTLDRVDAQPAHV